MAVLPLVTVLEVSRFPGEQMLRLAAVAPGELVDESRGPRTGRSRHEAAFPGDQHPAIFCNAVSEDVLLEAVSSILRHPGLHHRSGTLRRPG
ncbi:hypothetical protein BH23CHL4_BH23CHL4_09130 [soil metagenome]